VTKSQKMVSTIPEIHRLYKLCQHVAGTQQRLFFNIGLLGLTVTWVSLVGGMIFNGILYFWHLHNCCLLQRKFSLFNNAKFGWFLKPQG